MGGRFSGAQKEEDEDDDECEEEDESADFSSSQPKKVAASSSAVPTKNFVELAAEAAAKKKRAPAVAKNSAGAEFARLAAAKKAVAKAPKKTARAPPPDASEEQVLREVADDGLPRGAEGATWIALEDCPVREDRDIKSAKKGVIQKDESCKQTGPWRADPSGRVRMPVRGARCFGWVTVDATKCRGSDGSWGTRAFDLITEAPEEAVQEDEPNPPEGNADEIDDLLEMFGGDEPDSTQDYSDNVDELLGLYGGSDLRVTKEEHSLASEDLGLDASRGDKAERVSDLTPAQKRLRNARKKLRDLELLEAKPDALSASQRSRLERKHELFEEEKAAVAEVKKEQNAGKKKRPKQKKVATARDAKNSAGTTSAASARGYLIWFAVLPVVALSISYVLLNGVART